MPSKRGRRRPSLGLLALTALLLPLSACSKKPPTQDLQFGQTVRGKVTYKGQPVPYGFVVLYNPEAGIDSKTGAMTPAAAGMIDKEGHYEITTAPVGPAIFCIVTDPDLHPREILRPSTLGGRPVMGPPGANAAGGRPGGHFGGPQGGVPGVPPGGAKGGKPGDPSAGPPDLPPNIPRPGSNPITREFSDEQKKLLKEIHQKYGSFGRSRIGREIQEGEQTIDLDLK